MKTILVCAVLGIVLFYSTVSAVALTLGDNETSNTSTTSTTTTIDQNQTTTTTTTTTVDQNSSTTTTTTTTVNSTTTTSTTTTINQNQTTTTSSTTTVSTTTSSSSSSTTSTTSTTTSIKTERETTLYVTVPSSVYENETVDFKIRYVTGDSPITDADVILTISHEEINPLTNETYPYSEAYFIPWDSSGFYFYSLDLGVGLYNYTIVASKEGFETQEYEGVVTVKELPEERKTIEIGETIVPEENTTDEVPKESLKASLPLEGSELSELVVVFILFGLMCCEIGIFCFIVYRNMRREEEMMNLMIFLLIMNGMGSEA